MATLTPLSSGGNSAFNPRAFDLLVNKNPLAKLRSRGDTLWHADFDDGGDGGLRDHYANDIPKGLVSTTEIQPFTGSRAAFISTPETPFVAPPEGAAGTHWNGASTYKNLSQVRENVLTSISGWFSISGAGDFTTKPQQYPWASWGIGIDTQAMDDSWRSFFKVGPRDNGNGFQWYLDGDAGANRVPIPGTENLFSGMNEGKLNYCYVRLTVDLALRKYVELQIGGRIFDLTGIAGLGTASDIVLANGANDDFTGGMNFGIFLEKSTRNPGLLSNRLQFDELLWTVGDVAA